MSPFSSVVIIVRQSLVIIFDILIINLNAKFFFDEIFYLGFSYFFHRVSLGWGRESIIKLPHIISNVIKFLYTPLTSYSNTDNSAISSVYLFSTASYNFSCACMYGSSGLSRTVFDVFSKYLSNA